MNIIDIIFWIIWVGIVPYLGYKIVKYEMDKTFKKRGWK